MSRIGDNEERKRDEMKSRMKKTIDESIKLEMNVSSLYMLFYKLFPEDEAFWWQISIEEKNHAALIKGVRDVLLMEEQSLMELVIPDSGLLAQVNEKLADFYKAFSEIRPSRKTAFNLALKIEESAGELHFQKAMDKKSDNHLIAIFQDLNKDDINHVERIKAYMVSNNIPIEPVDSFI